MGIILKIAWRNLWRHKGKSLVVGTIIFVGAAIMTVGTGVISGMNEGLKKNIVKGFTGDIVLASDKQQGDNVFLDMMAQAVEPLPNYAEVKKVLSESGIVESWLPIGKNMAMVLNEDGGSMDGTFIMGVDIDQYNKFFPDNLELLQGTYLDSKEKGVLLGTGVQKIFVTSMGLFFMPESTDVDTSIMPDEAKKMVDDLSIKRTMVFMGFSSDNTSTDIRLPIRGLVKYKALNTIWGAFIIMDIESYRQCMGYVSAAHQQIEIPEESKHLLHTDEENLDALFSEGNLMVDDQGPSSSVFTETKLTRHTTADLDIDAGAYNLVLIKLKPGVKQKIAIAELDTLLTTCKTGVRPIAWQKSIGPLGGLAMLIKWSLFIFVMLLFFVAIVIIINTLTMAALERTSEIGMMRAIGARKEFIGNMFIAETAALASFFGGLGIAAGWIVVTIISVLELTTKNDMVQLIYGGDTFHPFLTVTDFLLVILQLTLVTLLAVIYPMFIARGITPLDAISRE